MSKIVVTGGSGRFGNILKKFRTVHKLYFPTKNELDILNPTKIGKYLNKVKPKYLIHLAGLSRPMILHEKNINKSIDLNIIGTANVTKACEKKYKVNIFFNKLCLSRNERQLKETDPIFPVNNYAWSKLGGEASVHLYNNSLILRVSMTEKPFVHKEAFDNVKTSFIYQEAVVPILFRLLKKV